MPDINVALAPLLALVGATLLLVRGPERLFPAIAFVASALETLRALALLNLKVPVLGAAVLFAIAMVLGGAGAWWRAQGRAAVTAATVVSFVGLLRLLQRYL